MVTTTSSGAITHIKTLSNGSYVDKPGSLAQAASSGNGVGSTFTLTWTPSLQYAQVILTNVQNAIIEYTRNDTTPDSWEGSFVTAIHTALSGVLAPALTGDKTLARDKIGLANDMILQARVADANEGLTVNDHVPDWLRVRGVGGELDTGDTFFEAYGPLFPVPF
jgi:hypothetical protein